MNYLYTGRWMKEHQFSPGVRVRGPVELTQQVTKSIADEEVLYLEFGVWKGDSMRRWSKLLRNRASRLHGFDSFEGLPEQWDDHSRTGLPLRKGHFSTHGVLPRILDTRVKFFKGWFEETLRKYDFVDSPVIVIFLDADLYSSTSYVLKTLRPHVKIGTIICFDDFWDPQHEQRAFEEFLGETGMKFELMVADYGMRHVAFKRIG